MENESKQMRPLETVDPAADGWGSMSLEEVVAAGRAAQEALEAYRLALYACRTPLNLKPTETAVASMTSDLRQQVNVLQGARRIIETDAPLAVRFPHKDPWAEETGGVLSPKQIVSLSRRAHEVLPAAHTTYREVIEQSEPVPTLLAKDRSMGFNAAGSTDMDEVQEKRADYRDQLVREILARLESVECGYCHAPPGSPCVTAAGGIAHVSHKPRQDQFPISPEQAWVRTYVNRRPDNVALNPELRGKSWMDRDNDRRENKNLVNEVIVDIAQTLSDLSR